MNKQFFFIKTLKMDFESAFQIHFQGLFYRNNPSLDFQL